MATFTSISFRCFSFVILTFAIFYPFGDHPIVCDSSAGPYIALTDETKEQISALCYSKKKLFLVTEFSKEYERFNNFTYVVKNSAWKETQKWLSYQRIKQFFLVASATFCVSELLIWLICLIFEKQSRIDPNVIQILSKSSWKVNLQVSASLHHRLDDPQQSEMENWGDHKANADQDYSWSERFVAETLYKMVSETESRSILAISWVVRQGLACFVMGIAYKISLIILQQILMEEYFCHIEPAEIFGVMSGLFYCSFRSWFIGLIGGTTIGLSGAIAFISAARFVSGLHCIFFGQQSYLKSLIQYPPMDSEGDQQESRLSDHQLKKIATFLGSDTIDAVKVAEKVSGQTFAANVLRSLIERFSD